MESPVIVENCVNYKLPVNTEETGFPFDDTEYDSGDHLQSTLHNIAQRHPEFADHLNFDTFPTWRRKRYGSGSSTDREDTRSHTPGQSSRSFDTPDGRRFADHSFPSGFNRFPFTHHFDDLTDDIRTEEKPPEVPRAHEKRGRKVNPNLPQHLSNTVDLGQKQTPVEENRGQRSMSAPPENRTTHGNSARFDSDPSRDMGSMFSRPSRSPQDPRAQNMPQSQSYQQTAKPKERVIPIHVEGREEPLMPKNVNIEPENVFSCDSNNVHQQHAYPQQSAPKRQNPPCQQQNTSHQSQFTKQSTPPAQAKSTTSQQEETTPSESQDHPQNLHQEQTPQVNINDPLEKIKSVKSDVLDLMQQVENFKGTRKDKHYIYLDEMLTRNLLKLDNVETEGKDNIRLARREAIKCIQECINKLEAKAQACEKQGAKPAEAESSEIQESLAESSSGLTESGQESVTETKKPPIFKSEAKIEIKVPEYLKEEAPDVQSEKPTEEQILTLIPAEVKDVNHIPDAVNEPMEVDKNQGAVKEIKSNSNLLTNAEENTMDVSVPTDKSTEDSGQNTETKPTNDTPLPIVTNPSQSADETNM